MQKINCQTTSVRGIESKTGVADGAPMGPERSSLDLNDPPDDQIIERRLLQRKDRAPV